MKKIHKSKAVALMSVSMLAMVAAGCGDTSAPASKETTAPPAASSAANATPAASKAPKDGNITILYHTTKEKYAEDKKNNPNAYDAVWETIPQYEKAYGGKVTVVAVPWGDQKSTLISMVNAGDRVDVAQANDQNFPVYPLKKIVQPINKYIDLNGPTWNKAVTKTFTFGGSPYAAGSTAAPIVIYYNKTLFTNSGVKTPSEYLKEGNWTWDTFRKVAKDLTVDTNGDGKPDQFGFGWWDAGYPLFVGSNGKTLLNFSDDGKISTNYDSDNVKEAIQFTQDALLKDKFVDKDKEGDYFNGEFKNGKLAMTAEYGLAGFTAFKSDYELDFVPVPTGPKGTKDVGPGGLSGWAIPTASKNPEGAAAFITMAAENELKVATDANVKAYGKDRVDQINKLADKILFTPIGVEKYFDANGEVLKGIKDGSPVGSFSANAKNILEEGIKITLTQ